ncbi:hypothetical protein BGZ98_004263 [Dissophora globulifera]|nr:hypothetical protein BGZ98_004263 [Dissophora globulifera]
MDIPVGALEPCSHPEFPKALVQLEERQIIQSYKFGIYQLLPGQTLERQGLANPRDTCTPDFMDFVSWLGDPIQLRGWTGYRAGLDVNGDTTGDTSIFTQWNDYQIMFHCAPFMPFNPNDDQQIERRRFIGNDIVIIIFKEKDDDEQFDFTSVRSRQNHVICIVRPIPSSSSSNCKSYRVTIAVKDGIRNFPPTDFPLLLQRDDAARDLLLLKLIAGERAAYKAKAFATQIVRTREALIRDVIEKYR